MEIKYKCLVLDHDDTVVESTPTIHYPSFLEALEKMRPDVKISLDQFISHCFEPGFWELMRDTLKFTPEEEKEQYKIWRKYTRSIIPKFFAGLKELLTDYKQSGGVLAVVSHSEKELILRDYQHNLGLEPDLVFGWEVGEGKRKPATFPLQQILRKYNLEPEEALMVDDLKPGLEMARKCHVPFAFAHWGQRVQKVKDYMLQEADFYPESVKDLRNIIFNIL